MKEIRKIAEDSEQYPPLLREIAQPPVALYIRGNSDILHDRLLVAVVGSRKASPYGKQCIQKLIAPAVRAGLIVVSGLAYGIDSLAHQVAVKGNQPTIAVLGCGIDDPSIYPRSNIRLAHQILETGGAIISEYAPGTAAYPYHFPARNRIIAGLCPLTIIIQAAEKSGSLITARLALDSNRDVGAVPGPITDKLSRGTNELIRQGAIPITGANDLLGLYNQALTTSTTPTKVVNDLSNEQRAILEQFTDSPLHLDILVERSSLPAPLVSGLITELELLDIIEHVGGKKYIKK